MSDEPKTQEHEGGKVAAAEPSPPPPDPPAESPTTPEVHDPPAPDAPPAAPPEAPPSEPRPAEAPPAGEPPVGDPPAEAPPGKALEVAAPEPTSAAVEPVVAEPTVAPAPSIAPPPPALAPPVLTAVRPSSGPMAGGNSVVVRGMAFEEGSTVTFAGALAAVTWESSQVLHAVVPARAEKGSVDVAVVRPDGLEARIVDAYRYDAAPSITGFAPPCVSLEGGDVLTILGAEFVEGAAVRIGDDIVPSSFANAGRLEAVTKRREPGEVVVSVENPDGQRVSGPTSVRFVAPPRIDGVVPVTVSTSGGAEIKLSGKGLEPGVVVLLGGVRIESVTRVSDGEVRFVAPARAEPGVADLTVVSPTGLQATERGALSFIKDPPFIESVTPEEGPSAGGTPLVVRGRGFDEGLTVLLCGIEAKTTWKSAGELLVVSPEVSRDGVVDLRVVNRDDQAHLFEGAYRYLAALPPPKLASVGTARGPQAGGLEVAILGEDFAEGCAVHFGGSPAKVTFLTHKELRATTPPRVGFGEVAVSVTNPDGATSVLEAAFTYEPKPAPEIAHVTPNFGPATGGTRVVIEGRNFTRDMSVYLGREHPKDIAVKSATEIVLITAPRKQAGVVDVELAVPGAVHGIAKNGFRYDAAPAPVVTSVSPNAGAPEGGTEMTISGKNFTRETAVTVGGKAPKTVKLIDAATLEFKTPPGDSGKMVDVVVRNPDGKEATQKRAFLYDPRYRG